MAFGGKSKRIGGITTARTITPVYVRGPSPGIEALIALEDAWLDAGIWRVCAVSLHLGWAWYSARPRRTKAPRSSSGLPEEIGLLDLDPAEQVVPADRVQKGRMVGGHVIADDPDHPVIAVTSRHEPALAADELRHRSSQAIAPSVVPRCWRDLGVFRRLDVLHIRALECYAAASLGIAGAELAGAVRAGQQLIRLAPLRESGYRYLMQALAAQDNLAEAVHVYGQLCDCLREQLGVSPSPATRHLYERILAAT